jgi:hypothetical protein
MLSALLLPVSFFSVLCIYLFCSLFLFLRLFPSNEIVADDHVGHFSVDGIPDASANRMLISTPEIRLPILALLNDISMIPVAYDNAQATTRPQLPNAKKIVMMSMFYGVVHTVGNLVCIVALDEAASLKYPISLEREFNAETRGFIWYHLVLVTELMIFQYGPRRSFSCPGLLSIFWLLLSRHASEHLLSLCMLLIFIG